MIEIGRASDLEHTRGREGRGPIATSLFGGAILASVATASLAQATYFDTASLLAHGSVTTGYVVLGGNLALGDGGGGTFMKGPAGCGVGDHGIIFPDGSASPNCFYRADPTYSVREWGARCDVVSVNAAGAATWNPGTPTSIMGTLTVPSMLLPGTPNVTSGDTIYIAISQIGSPTLFGTLTPAVSLTRYSTLSNTGSFYKAGDLVSFAGGTFSQQAAIIVDAVDSGGAITQWHFLWGGLYDPGTAPTSMAQDNARSFCGSVVGSGYVACGAGGRAIGATLAPAWSGWSVLNSLSISNTGSNYSVGDVLTLSASGAVANPGHPATLVVESTSTLGGVTAYDWLDYGSYSAPSTTGTPSATGGSGSGLAFGSVGWTQGPYASTIASAGTVGSNTTIVVAGTASFPGAIAVQAFYYGHDDSAAITNALGAKPASALIIPAGCGTTVPLQLSQDSSANNLNPSLVGSNLQSSGLYAFAYPPGGRSTSKPVLSSVLYGGLFNGTHTSLMLTRGGGFRNLLVEGFGIPEGYGYWGLVQNFGTPSGYMGPTASPSNIPTAGTAVEIDKMTYIRIDNAHITDGGIGMGNSAFQCSLDESDPTGALKADVGNIVFTDSRIDSNPQFIAGPSNPEFAVRVETSCHDSVYQNLAAFDGTKADVLLYNGNVFGQFHLGSNAVNATQANVPAPTLNWATITTFGSGSTVGSFGLAGVADYGIYGEENTSFSQTRCDIANVACVFLSINPGNATTNPAQVTDSQIGCGAFTSVPPGYYGVTMQAKTGGSTVSGTTVSGTAAPGKCAMPPLQLINLVGGGPIDQSSSLCNNSNASAAACTGYQGSFANGQFYTQPAVAYGTAALSGGATTSTLYAVPFYSPAGGGTITKLGLQVISHAATQCVVGIYNAFAGRPTSLIANSSGTIAVTSNSAVTTTGSLSAQLAPATLYFLSVGCNGTISVEGVTSTGGATIPLTGAPDFTTTTAGLSATWTFASSLPVNFGTATIATGGPVPNVYAGP